MQDRAGGESLFCFFASFLSRLSWTRSCTPFVLQFRCFHPPHEFTCKKQQDMYDVRSAETNQPSLLRLEGNLCLKEKAERKRPARSPHLSAHAIIVKRFVCLFRTKLCYLRHLNLAGCWHPLHFSCFCRQTWKRCEFYFKHKFCTENVPSQ